MRVLISGGSGVIGGGVVARLLAHGHAVRLLARGADAAAREWPGEVEARAADICEPEQLNGVADDCDAVVHVTGIVRETPPKATFRAINVEGTRHLLDEATRAGLPRFVYISSLGAERGSSPYHQSKREAEALVREYGGAWLILRPGNVYGPGDEVISMLLGMHRTLPVLPVLGAGDHRFQPIWYLDLAEAIVRALDPAIAPGEYDLAGDDVSTPHDILDRFSALTGQSPLRVPIPEFLAAAGTKLAEAAGVTLPFNQSQVQMLIEHNVIAEPGANALTRVFGVSATPLDVGLARLAEVQLEQKPSDGIGALERKRFWADIRGSRLAGAALMHEFRRRCTELLPIAFDAEPGAPQVVEKGTTLTASLPLRGHVQIRVVETSECTMTFATLRGHPLAGAVRFRTSERADGDVRFSITVTTRAATQFDWVAMHTVGAAAQTSTWLSAVERVIEMSGGESSGVEQDHGVLTAEQSASAERWIDDLVESGRLAEHTDLIGD